MLKIIQTFFITLTLFFIISVKELYAFALFSDDFNYKDNSKWSYLSNDGSIDFVGGVMNLSSSSLYFPYITNSIGQLLSSDGNEVIEFKFNYKYIDYMGDGIGVGYTGVNGYPYFQFSIWDDLTTGPVLQYQDKSVSSNGVCIYTSGLKKISLKNKITDNSWHIFKIEKILTVYKIFLDNELILTTPENQCIPSNIMVGNPLSGGRTWWSKLSLDYIKVFTGNYIQNKIVIIPGLGASWNPISILSNIAVPANQWTMTPFVKNYDLLITAFENNGLVKNQDFYVWNYDWRKPLSQIVNDFNIFVNTLNLKTGQKIDLVGHSLGGLVARLWTQDHPTLVDKSITLGSPHFGSVMAYEAWNGAKISDNLDIASIALNVLLQVQKKNNDTAVQTLRKYAPIVFDLSPTFTFLKRNGSNVIGKYSSYLMDKNNLVTAINEKLSTIDGKGVNTIEGISLGDRSLFDKVLGIWEDGRPLSYVNGVGDGTVLKKSAQILGSEIVEFDSNHGEIVDKSTNWVLEKLGLGVTINLISSYPQKQAIFYSDSQATMNVNCGGIEMDENDGWVIVEDQDGKNCQINLLGNDNGDYHVVTNSGNNWQYFEGTIANNEVINIDIGGSEVYWQSLKQNLSSIGAVNAVSAVTQKNIILAIDEYIKYRSTSKIFRFSEEILENMRYLLNTKVYLAFEIRGMYLKALASKSLVETNLRLMSRRGTIPTYSSALNNEQANILMKNGENYAANYIANKLYGIVWK